MRLVEISSTHDKGIIDADLIEYICADGDPEYTWIALRNRERLKARIPYDAVMSQVAKAKEIYKDKEIPCPQ